MDLANVKLTNFTFCAFFGYINIVGLVSNVLKRNNLLPLDHLSKSTLHKI